MYEDNLNKLTCTTIIKDIDDIPLLSFDDAGYCVNQVVGPDSHVQGEVRLRRRGAHSVGHRNMGNL